MLLTEKIEELRRELERELKCDNLNNGKLLEISQVLDALIYEYTANCMKGHI